MKRAVMAFSAVVSALMAAAMPAKEDLAKARPLVKAAVAADVTSLKSGSMKPGEAAARHMKLAVEAKDEASKYLFLQGAFLLYAKAGDAAAASAVLWTMNREISDMNPEVIAEICRKVNFSPEKVRPARFSYVNGRPAALKFALTNGVELVLEGCPAGTFTMGYPDGPWNADGKAAPLHKVTISRPFWIGRFQVTRGQAKAMGIVPDGFYPETQCAIDGRDGDTCSAVLTLEKMNAFLRMLTERHAADIPPGYVFRLASDAEWEYASKAGDYSDDNPAMRYSDHPVSPYILSIRDKTAMLKEKGIEWKGNDVTLPAFPVGLKRPNAWGIYDMLGNHPEVTLDRVPKRSTVGFRYCVFDDGISSVIAEMTYKEHETDPLMYCKTDWNVLVRGRWNSCLAKEGLRADGISWMGGHGYAFRVCLGPNLVAERR